MIPLKIVHEPPTELLYGDEALRLAKKHTLEEIERARTLLADAETFEGDKVARLKKSFWLMALVLAVGLLCTLPFIVDRWIAVGMLVAASLLVPLHVYIERRVHHFRMRQWHAEQVYRLASLIREEMDEVSLAASDIRVLPSLPPPGSVGPD